MDHSNMFSSDLDLLHIGIQQKIFGKEDTLKSLTIKFIEKYKKTNILELDKKLLDRFYLRLSELMEKCKNQDQIDYLITIQKKFTTMSFIRFLEVLYSTIDQKTNEIVNQQNKQSQGWQINNKLNKNLFQFYEDQFWKLYGLLSLNQDHIDNMIQYYQTKQENVERLLKLNMERNKQFNYLQQQKPPPQVDILHRNHKTPVSFLNRTIDPSRHNRNQRIREALISNQKLNNYTIQTKSPKKQSRPTSKEVHSENEQFFSQLLNRRSKLNSQEKSNSFYLLCESNNKEKVLNSVHLQLNSFQQQSSLDLKASAQRKISSIDLNQSLNQYIIQSESATPKKQQKKQRFIQKINQTFYQQLFPTCKTRNRGFAVLKNQLFNESRALNCLNITISNYKA
ncbi:unnamed protein product [Paramecium primaurelia]|uniref:Uncharacterized protein n=1 Tax=Paramecium primaurelia TaxID=5886 RepID=A0A8S1Q5S2_PARPR|nr:unnamed protein product [Paramecium primaurelia]